MGGVKYYKRFYFIPLSSGLTRGPRAIRPWALGSSPRAAVGTIYKYLRLFFCGGALLIITAKTAFAAAWPQAPGRGLQILAYRFDRATEAFDANGNSVEADFTKHEADLYLEIGVTKRLTFIVRTPYQAIDDRNADPPQTAVGWGDTDFAVRGKVFEKAGFVGALQAQYTAPGVADGAGPSPLTTGGASYEARALVGKGFSQPLKGFANLETAYRWRDGAPPDEWRVDATAGLEFGEKTQVLAQTFSVLSNGAGGLSNPAFRSHKGQLSVVYRVTDIMRVQVGGFATLGGENVLKERGALASLWFDFGWGGTKSMPPIPTAPSARDRRRLTTPVTLDPLTSAVSSRMPLKL